MEKAIVFGTGGYYQKKKHRIMQNFEVIAFADNDITKRGSIIDGKTIISPKEIINFQFDKVIIASQFYPDIARQLINLGVSETKIVLGINILPRINDELNIEKSNNNFLFKVEENGDIVAELDKVNLKFNNFNEAFIINEIFGRRIYDFSINFEDLIVVDIGMNIGTASIFFASKNNVKKVYAYEPFTPTYNLALKNISLNPKLRNKIKAYNFGLGEKEEVLTLSYCKENKGRMSTVSEINASIKNENTEKSFIDVNVCLKDVVQEIKSINVENPNYKLILKVDCEGSEYQIVKRLDEANLFKNIKIIMMEWHYGNPKAIEEILKKHNFVSFTSYEEGIAGMIYAVNLS